MQNNLESDQSVGSNLDNDYLVGLVRELCKLPQETEWVEFKVGNFDPQSIGEYISALANAAALAGKTHGYVVWGVEDETHAVVGTKFGPAAAKQGNEPLQSWLVNSLQPRIEFRFHESTVDGRRVVLLEIDCAMHQPISFKGNDFIRVGSTKRRLKDHPEKERALWRVFDSRRFEDSIAAEHVTGDEVLLRLDYSTYFDLLQRPLPRNSSAILDVLRRDHLIESGKAGRFNITNLGAMLFAKQLSDFPSLKRKAIRVIQYRGNGRMETIREQEGGKGYASGFEGLISHLDNILPTNEVIEKALRKTVPMFPNLAIREIVANALIHQDFFVTGAGPMIEIFDDRIEVTNPGQPLVDTQRFLDTPPKSRNETLASLMRRVRICEERGSGIDKVVFEVELYQLPAPLFEAPPGSTRVVLFAHKPLSDMDTKERVRACYLHACLKHVMGDFLTNASLRERLGINAGNKAVASRRIREAVQAGAIRPFDEHAAPKLMKYVPFWA